jgi:hypothetical protein
MGEEAVTGYWRQDQQNGGVVLASLPFTDIRMAIRFDVCTCMYEVISVLNEDT